MLRREPSASILTRRLHRSLIPDEEDFWEQIPPRLEFGPYRAGGHDGFEIEESAVQTLAEENDLVIPVYLGTHTMKDHRSWWMYRENFYSTAEDLTPDDAKALIEEQENRKRLKIARAKTVAAMAEALDDSPQRTHIAQDVKITVWQRDKGRCVACGSNESLEFDHVIPLSAGGSNSIRNLQLLCEQCNRRKGATLGVEDIQAPRKR